MGGYPGAQNKFNWRIGPAFAIPNRPLPHAFELWREGNALEVAFHQEASPVFGDDFSCSAQLAASSPALQPLFCQKTGT
jgi:hypothetical protein